MLQGVQERNRQDTCKQVKVNNANLVKNVLKKIPITTESNWAIVGRRDTESLI